MEDRFQFRALTLEGNVIEVNTIEFFEDGQIHVNEEIPTQKLLQCTGLRDKNGTLIFEGDIVKRENWGSKIISFIEYRDHGFWIKDESFGYEGEDLWDWGNIEVIGNIYENPELLN